MLSSHQENHDIHFRPIESEDLPFLQRVYASTRESELAQTDWSEEQKSAFLQMQFDMQHQYYQQHFKSAQFLIVMLQGRDIGRLYTEWRNDELRVIDIALLPPYRGRGIGTALLHDLLDRAAEKSKAVGLYVEYFNPALSLYRRLGFQETGGNGVYQQMICYPSRRILPYAAAFDNPQAGASAHR